MQESLEVIFIFPCGFFASLKNSLKPHISLNNIVVLFTYYETHIHFSYIRCAILAFSTIKVVLEVLFAIRAKSFAILNTTSATKTE